MKWRNQTNPFTKIFIIGDNGLIVDVTNPAGHSMMISHFLNIGNLGDNESKQFSYSLSNDPNPFNSSTKITFSIPREDNVRVVVFDIIGREIAVIFLNKIRAGKHTIAFNGNNLATGTYFYQLWTGDNFIGAKKMTLMK